MNEVLNKIYQEKPDFNKIPGGFEDNSIFSLGDSINKSIKHYDESAIIFNFLNFQQVNFLKNLIFTFPKAQEVSISGMTSNLETKNNLSKIGSFRNTIFSKNLSEEFNKIFNSFIGSNKIIKTDDLFPSDTWQNLIEVKHEWEFISCSPMFRFMSYYSGGQHVPHYDASYIYNFDNTVRTLYSFVLYLTTNKTGSTRFIKDNQEMIKIHKRDHSDWERLAISQEVLYEEFPEFGKMLIFPHRMCHDVAQFLPENKNEVRQIIRGDLIFKQI